MKRGNEQADAGGRVGKPANPVPTNRKVRGEGMKGKTLCVTGGSGFIASHLIKALKKENPKEILNLDLRVGCNLTEYREVQVFFEKNKVDIVFDLATLPLPVSLKEPYKVVNDCVRMILNLCELQRLGAFGRLVHISSSEAYGTAKKTRLWIGEPDGERYEDTYEMDEDHQLKPRTPYASAKAAGDLIALAYHQTFNSDIIIPRSYNAYGPRQPLNWGAVIPKTIDRILSGHKPIIFKDGKQTRDFVFVKDIVKAIILVANTHKKGIVVNIGTGIETPITELIHLIARLMNYKGDFEYQTQRIADVSRHCANVELLQELTGYKPETSLDDGLKETIAYYRSVHNSPAVCQA